MFDKFIFFLADNINTLMSITGGLLMVYGGMLMVSGVMNKNSETTLVGCTLAIMGMMITIFV